LSGKEFVGKKERNFHFPVVRAFTIGLPSKSQAINLETRPIPERIKEGRDNDGIGITTD